MGRLFPRLCYLPVCHSSMRTVTTNSPVCLSAMSKFTKGFASVLSRLVLRCDATHRSVDPLYDIYESTCAVHIRHTAMSLQCQRATASPPIYKYFIVYSRIANSHVIKHLQNVAGLTRLSQE
jgi:hypothetical protein